MFLEEIIVVPVDMEHHGPRFADLAFWTHECREPCGRLLKAWKDVRTPHLLLWSSVSHVRMIARGRMRRQAVHRAAEAAYSGA